MEERYQRNRIYITPEEQCKVKETKILLGGVGLGSVIVLPNIRQVVEHWLLHHPERAA